MADFARALKQLRGLKGAAVNPGGDSAGAQELTYSAVSFSISDQLHFLKSQASRLQTSILPEGEVHSTPYGSHYVVRAVYPHDHFHGKVLLQRFSASELQSLMALMREEGAAVARDQIIFLDTETTGMQGGAGMCPFLVGVGFFAGDEFHMVQYFIRDFDEDPSMLFALSRLLSRFQLVVTYNGAAFDIPLLETRFRLARLENPFGAMSHFDLLFTARKLWRAGHGSCRLVALESELLSFHRGPDVPGFMIPRIYFDFLQQRPSLMLRGVFTHNVHDVVSLAALTIQACDRVTAEPALLDDPMDLYSVARVFESSLEWRRSQLFYEMALKQGLPEPVHRKALESLSVVYRRLGDYERSFQVCSELMALPVFSMAGYEGAAVYYEKVAGDAGRALEVVDAGMKRLSELDEKKRWTILLRARWTRLQQKVIRFA